MPISNDISYHKDSLVAQMWRAADASRDNNETVRMRAQAEFLALFMTPHYRTADDVLAELDKRYEARQNGTGYATWGMDDLRTMFKDDPKRPTSSVKKYVV